MKNLIDFAIFTLVQFFFITHVLIYLYQGGSYYHPEEVCFTYNQNYLSDLGRAVYFNGFKNPFWIFYTISLSLVGIGTALFFYITSKLLVKKSIIPVVLGIISGISYIGIAIFMVDLYFNYHIFFGVSAFVAFLAAGISLNFMIDKEDYPNIYYTLMFLNGLLILYLLLRSVIPSSSEAELYLKIRVIMQRVVVYSQLFAAAYILYRIKQRFFKIKIQA